MTGSLVRLALIRRAAEGNGPAPREAPEGDDDRQVACRFYDACLDVAARKAWSGFVCDRCPLRGIADRDHAAEVVEAATARRGGNDEDTAIARARPASGRGEGRAHACGPELLARVLAFLAAGPKTRPEIGAAIEGNTDPALSELVQAGKIERPARGLYCLPGQSPLDLRNAHQAVVDRRIAEVVAKKAPDRRPRLVVPLDPAEPIRVVRAAPEPEPIAAPEPPAPPAEEKDVEGTVTKTMQLRALRNEIADLEKKLAGLRDEARDLARERLEEMERERAEFAPLAGEAEADEPEPEQPAAPAKDSAADRILAILEDGGTYQAREIEKAVRNASPALTALLKRKAIVRVGRGLYRAA